MEPLFRIAVDLNLNVPGLGQAMLDALLGIRATQANMERRIMATLEEVQAAAAAQNLKIAELAAQVEEGNTKTDALILVATTTKDTLVAVQAELEALKASGGVASGALDGVLNTLNQGTAALQTAIDSANAQDAQTDSAAAAVAP